MIDEEFSPSTEQLLVLGHLFLDAQNRPWLPVSMEADLYERVIGSSPEQRPSFLLELVDLGLVGFLPSDDGRLVPKPLTNSDGSYRGMLGLTPSGVFYCLSRPDVFSENEHGVQRDLPGYLADALWSVHDHYSPSTPRVAPAADGPVSFDHNAPSYRDVVGKLDAVSDALRSDNEIGAEYADVRDRKLEELRKIRELIQKGSNSTSRLTLMVWGALGYLMTQFADRPVGQLAEAAWTAFKHLVGFQ